MDLKTKILAFARIFVWGALCGACHHSWTLSTSGGQLGMSSLYFWFFCVVFVWLEEESKV
jgi:hypothetical protein